MREYPILEAGEGKLLLGRRPFLWLSSTVSDLEGMARRRVLGYLPLVFVAEGLSNLAIDHGEDKVESVTL